MNSFKRKKLLGSQQLMIKIVEKSLKITMIYMQKFAVDLSAPNKNSVFRNRIRIQPKKPDPDPQP